MGSFKQFYEAKKEEEKDVEETLAQLPLAHQQLLKDCKFKFHNGNTLKNDDEHIGYMDSKTGEICVAAPWKWSKEFTFLHEVGHKVFDHLPDTFKNRWANLAKTVESKFKDHDPEELFCMIYAQSYVKHKMKEFNLPTLVNFVRSLQ